MKIRKFRKLMGVVMAIIMIAGLMPAVALAEENAHASHSGSVTHIEATMGNCTTPGNIEFWYCSYYTCDKCYSDEGMTEEISPADVVITPGVHSNDCVGCEYSKTEENFELFVPSEHPYYDEDDYANSGMHTLTPYLDGFKFLFVGEYNGKLYAMGNETNEDGSRVAIDLSEFVEEDGSVTVDSDTVEFFTYKELSDTYILSPDNGYMTVLDGKIVVHGENLCDVDTSYDVFPQSIRFEQSTELSDYAADKGYLFGWALNSPLILFDDSGAQPKFSAVLSWSEDENGDAIDNRAHNIMLYMERCEHPDMIHNAAVEATCTEDGNLEYWYCEDCKIYFANAEATEYIVLPEGYSNYEYYLTVYAPGHEYGDDNYCDNCGEIWHPNAIHIEGEVIEPSCFEPGSGPYWLCEDCGMFMDESKENEYWEEAMASKVPATGHAFNTDTGKCDNCGLENPVYTKITSLDDINEEDMYIFVAKIGDKYFALGGLDEETSGETNEQGIIDCGENINAIEVVPYEDGSISLLNQNYVGNAVPSEFMLDVNPEQWNFTEMGLTTVMPLLPNYCVYSFQSYSLYNTGYMGVPRYVNGEYGMWDGGAWAIDFYTTEVDDDTYRDDMDGYTHAEQVARGNIDENIAEGDLLMYPANYYAIGGAMFTLRFREYVNEDGDTEYYFICGEDWALVGSEGWDSETDTTPTNDNQYAISLYRYDVPTVDNHTCEFTNWKDNEDGTHTGSCECGKTKTEDHTWDDGTETKAPTCYEEGETTYTCTSECGATNTEAIKVTEHEWSKWEDVGEDKHSRICLVKECGETEEDTHDFGKWDTDGKENHKKTCSVCEGTRTEEHEWDNGKSITEPTCVKEGSILYTCQHCPENKEESVASEPDNHNLGKWESKDADEHIHFCLNEGCDFSETETHNIKSEVVQAETCDDEGQNYISCDVCGYENYTTRPALGHKWSDWEVVVAPTETTEGTEQRICQNDNSHIDEREIPVLEHKHKMTNTPGKAATCTEDGNISYYCCEGCNGKFSDIEGNSKLNEEDVILPALDHDWDEWEDTGVNAVADVHSHSCKREGCGISETENHEWSKWTSEGGTAHKKTCSVCKGERTREHALDEGETVKEATVTETGIKKYACVDCGFEKSEVISKIVCDHSFGKWIADDDETHTHVCINENGCTAYQRQNHMWNDGEITKEATETEEGVITYTCLVCSHSMDEAIPMLKHKHRFGAWETGGESGHIRYCENGETCTAAEKAEHKVNSWADNKDGTHSGKCSVCSEEVVKAHSFGDWKEDREGNFKRTCKCGAYDTLIVEQSVEEAVTNTTKAENNGANATLKVQNGVELFNSVLTEEEQASVASGNATVGVYLDVTDIPVNEVSATDKEVAEAVIGEEENGLDETTEIGMYLNIELFKEVVSDNEVAETQITETSGKITITIEIPEELINTDKSKKRTYRIIRIHEDETGNIVTDVIEGNFNKGDNSFSFKTDKFSTYAVVYNDKDAPKRVATGGGGGSVVYTVKFETNGGSNVEKKSVKMNETIAEPEAPVREGFEFGGWYTDELLEKAYDFNTKVIKSFTLFAKWNKVEKIEFKDVKETDKFYPYVLYVVSNNLMVGVSDDEFEPEGNLTRAMLVTILYRAEGEPATNRSIPFSDVDMGAYYGNAVSWAKQNGIVNGVTENEFAPDKNVTREQLAAIMLRYAVYKGMNALTMEENLHFDDASEISEYAISSLNWAVGKGFIKERSKGNLMPKAFATRAEIAEFFTGYLKNE